MHGQLAQVGQPPFLKQRKMFGGRSRSRFRAEITANCAAPAASSRVLHKAERGAASNLLESLNRESATRERAVTAVYLQLGIFITDYEEIYL